MAQASKCAAEIGATRESSFVRLRATNDACAVLCRTYMNVADKRAVNHHDYAIRTLGSAKDGEHVPWSLGVARELTACRSSTPSHAFIPRA